MWANGSIRSRLRYDPWGKQRYAQNITPTGYRYTAQRFDDKLGLYDYQARYYDPHIGRFISADPYVPGIASGDSALIVDFHNFMDGSNKSVPNSPQNLNRYSYVGNNPLKYVDPTGHNYNPADHFVAAPGSGVAIDPSELLTDLGDLIDDGLLHDLHDLVNNLEQLAYLLRLGSAIVSAFLAILKAVAAGTTVYAAAITLGLWNLVGASAAAAIVAAASWLAAIPPLLAAAIAIFAIGQVASLIIVQIASELRGIKAELESKANAANMNSDFIVIELISESGWLSKGYSAVIYRVDSSGGVVAGSRHSPISHGYWANYMLTSLLNKHYG